MKHKVSEIKVSYLNRGRISESVHVSSPKLAAKVFFELWDRGTISLHESFKILLLNNAHKVKGIYTLSNGGITGTLVDIRLLYAVVLKSLSTAIIMAHNHPSGKLEPSEADKHLTQKIIKAAQLFEIAVLDHLILTPDGDYYSFSERGLM